MTVITKAVWSNVDVPEQEISKAEAWCQHNVNIRGNYADLALYPGPSHIMGKGLTCIIVGKGT